MSKGTIKIDFASAKIISNYIEDDKNIASNLINNFNSANDIINKLPSKYFASTLSEFSNLKEYLDKIDDMINNFSYSFDSSVENYYNEENGIALNNVESIPIDDLISNSKSTYTWGYKQSASSINRVDPTEMEKYLLSKGATNVQDGIYVLNIDGTEYKYDINKRWLTVNGERIKCDFYVSSNYNNLSVDNVVALLGGTGERGSGPIGEGKINDSIAFGDNSLLVVPYSGDVDKAISTSGVMKGLSFGEEVFNVNSEATKSIVGFSEGGHVMSKVISENPDSFDNAVFVNSATYTMDASRNVLRNGNYEGFGKSNIIYLETANGWSSDGNGQIGIVKSIDDLVSHGVDPSNITLVTNDSNLCNKINANITIDQTMTPPTEGNVRNFSGHGRGAWDIFNNSGIIDYLST